ncbi:hypothetical protein [Escherichia phage UPEC06]|nr:hypothetical protein [Escherichia phage UPEC06]
MKPVYRYDLVGDMDGNCNINEARMEKSEDGLYVKYREYKELLRAFKRFTGHRDDIMIFKEQAVQLPTGWKLRETDRVELINPKGECVAYLSEIESIDYWQVIYNDKAVFNSHNVQCECIEYMTKIAYAEEEGSQ